MLVRAARPPAALLVATAAERGGKLRSSATFGFVVVVAPIVGLIAECTPDIVVTSRFAVDVSVGISASALLVATADTEANETEVWGPVARLYNEGGRGGATTPDDASVDEPLVELIALECLVAKERARDGIAAISD